jgi:hypothetical protein
MLIFTLSDLIPPTRDFLARIIGLAKALYDSDGTNDDLDDGESRSGSRSTSEEDDLIVEI